MPPTDAEHKKLSLILLVCAAIHRDMGSHYGEIVLKEILDLRYASGLEPGVVAREMSASDRRQAICRIIARTAAVYFSKFNYHDAAWGDQFVKLCLPYFHAHQRRLSGSMASFFREKCNQLPQHWPLLPASAPA